MNPAAFGTAAGGAGGGLLGQIGDVLSAPRRYSWDLAAQGLGALGIGDGTAPASGADLLSQSFGMDQESPWTQALGFGAEMALDPLTYSGMFLGGPMGKMAAKATGQEAAVASEIQALTAARRAAQEGLVNRAAGEAETVAKYGDQARGLVQNFEGQLPSIAGGQTRTYNSFMPGVMDDLEASGMGQMNEAGQMVTLGQGVPPGMTAQHLQTPYKGQMYGSVLDYDPSQRGFPRSGSTPQQVYQEMQPLLPDELNWMKQRTADELGNGMIDGPSKWRSMTSPQSPFGTDDLMSQFAHEQALAANSTRPMPSLATAMTDQFLPTGGLPQSMLDAPLPTAFEMAQSNLKKAMELKKSMQMNGGDYARIAGAAGAGSYAGGMMGFGENNG